jgi:hypothetical protein
MPTSIWKSKCTEQRTLVKHEVREQFKSLFPKDRATVWSGQTHCDQCPKKETHDAIWLVWMRLIIILHGSWHLWKIIADRTPSLSGRQTFCQTHTLQNQYVDRKAPSDKNVWSVIDLRSTGTVGIRELKSWRGNCLKLQRSMLMNLKSQESEMTSGLHAHARCYSDAPVFLRLLLFACMAHISFLTFCDSCCFACSSYLQFYFGTLWNSLSSVPVPYHWHMHMFAEFVRNDDLHTKKQRPRVNRTTQVPDAGMAPCSRVPCHEWQGNT